MIVKSKVHNYEVTFGLRPVDARDFFVVGHSVYDRLVGYSGAIQPRRLHLVNSNEDTKTLDGVMALYHALAKAGFTKDDTLVAVGGGTIQDLTGFVAAAYKRGVYWEYWPTTLLGMLDSCVGGKVGINYLGVKNQLGAFYPPHKVRIEEGFLESLPPRDLHSGMMEGIKTYLIADAPLPSTGDIGAMIRKCLKVKRRIVEVDEFDHNVRNYLNFGHTIGHAYEVLSGYAIPHGYAVGAAMIVKNELSGYGKRAKAESVIRALFDADMEQSLQRMKFDGLKELMKKDKKSRDGKIVMVLKKDSGMSMDTFDDDVVDRIIEIHREKFRG